MPDTTTPAQATPWQVVIYPSWYDDDQDHGYMWAGDATDEADAVRQACEACEADNDVDREDPTDEYRWLDPKAVETSDAGPCYRMLYERLKGEARVLAVLMEDALTTHIYDLQNGDVIPPDSGYVQAIEAVRQACGLKAEEA